MFGLDTMMIVMSIVNAMAQVYMQMEAAEAQNEALEAQYRQKEAEVEVEQDQITEQSAIEQFEEARRALRDKASARVSSAESGALGNTFSRVLMEADMDELLNMANIETKHNNAIEKTQMELDAFSTKASVEAADVNLGLAGLQIAGAGVNAYAATGGFKDTPQIPVNSTAGLGMTDTFNYDVSTGMTDVSGVA